MKISGLQKLTLLDFPSHTACTVFTQGCNMACTFCHNSQFIPKNNKDWCLISECDFFEFLNKRKKVLEGVCISGGEPLFQDDIFDFMREIKKMGFLIKLDTNGSFPEKLQFGLENSLFDYIAMDIKNSQNKYFMTTGTDIFNKIEKSVKLILSSNIDYEFRTTVVKNLHTESDFKEMGEMCTGAKNFYLQEFVNSENVLDKTLEAPSKEELSNFLKIIKNYIPGAKLR